MDKIIIPVDEIKKDFQSVLDIEGNSRVLFSGKFGIGKTYFLNDFFEVDSEKFDVYHLYPVNYQIHGNDDILQLIKYDLLVELTKKNENIFQTNKVEGIKESSLLFYAWVKENFSINQAISSTISLSEYISDASADPIIGVLGKLGRPFKSILGIDKKYQEFKKEYESGEKGLVEKYEKAIRTTITSEPDYISSLVNRKIAQNKKDRKSVLVLDDMDRVDPEHIFRLLNVLSAHFERDQHNKFHFDSIIIVADYSNIKHIFHHQYGSKTDFDGYMDKFFTITPYYFDNKKALIAKVDEIVKKIRNEDPELNDAIGESGYIKLFLEHIFTKAVDEEIINLRQLLKATNFQLVELRKGSFYQGTAGDKFTKIFDIAVKVAILSFSNADNFIEKIEIIKKRKNAKTDRMPFERYIEVMLKSFGVEVPKGDEEAVSWNGYTIKKSQDGYTILEVEDGKIDELFYTLLIEYVQEKKYLSNR